METLDRNTTGTYTGTSGIYNSYREQNNKKIPGPSLMGASALVSNDVYNHKDEDLGEIKEIMLDMRSGRIAYAVLSYGGFLGMGEKLFAVPWNALTRDPDEDRFILNVEKERLHDAPGFDKDTWPDMANQTWAAEVHSYYRTKPYYNSSL